jgi:hypothetical protein
MKERETRSKIMKHFVLSKVRIEDDHQVEKNANEKKIDFKTTMR